MEYLKLVLFFHALHTSLQYDEALNEEFNQGFPLPDDYPSAAFFEGYGQGSMIPFSEDESPNFVQEIKEVIPVKNNTFNQEGHESTTKSTHNKPAHKRHSRKKKGHISTKKHGHRKPKHGDAAQRDTIEGNYEQNFEPAKESYETSVRGEQEREFKAEVNNFSNNTFPYESIQRDTVATEAQPNEEQQHQQNENLAGSLSQENSQVGSSSQFDSSSHENSQTGSLSHENSQIDSSNQINYDREELQSASQYYGTQLLPGDLPPEELISSRMAEHDQHDIEEQADSQPQSFVSEPVVTENGAARQWIHKKHHKHQTPQIQHNNVVDKHLADKEVLVSHVQRMQESNNNLQHKIKNTKTMKKGASKFVQLNHPSNYKTPSTTNTQPSTFGALKSNNQPKISKSFKTKPATKLATERLTTKEKVKIQKLPKSKNPMSMSTPKKVPIKLNMGTPDLNGVNIGVSALKNTKAVQSNQADSKHAKGSQRNLKQQTKNNKKPTTGKDKDKAQQKNKKSGKNVVIASKKSGKECTDYIGCLESWFQKYRVRITPSLDSVTKLKEFFSDIYKSDYMISFKSEVKGIVQKLFDMRLINWAIMYNYHPNFASWMNIMFLRMPLALETPTNLQQKVVFQRILLLKENQDEIKDRVRQMKNLIVKKRSVSSKIQTELKSLQAEYEFLQDSIENLRDNATISGIYQDEAPAISISGYDRNSYIWSRCAPKEANGDLYAGMYRKLMDMNSYQCVLYAFMKCIRDMEREERLSGYRIENKKKQGSFERYKNGFISLIQLHYDYGAKQNRLLPIEKNSTYIHERLTSAYCESAVQVKCLQEDGTTKEDALKFEDTFYCQNYFGCYITCGESCFLRERNLLPDERDRLMTWLSKDQKKRKKADIELWGECCSNIQNCLPLTPVSKKN